MMGCISTILQRFRADQSGSTAIEYGLLAALITVALVLAIALIGTKLSSTFTILSNSLP